MANVKTTVTDILNRDRVRPAQPRRKVTDAEIEQAEAINMLRDMLPPGSTVYCVLCSVSRSGMTREIKLYTFKDGDRQYLSGYVARVLDYAKRGKQDGNVVGGCGMDMGRHLVSNLSYALYPKGFGCIGKGDSGRPGTRCPSNDHANGDRDYKRHGAPSAAMKNHPRESLHVNHWHSSGSYALRCEWL